MHPRQVLKSVVWLAALAPLAAGQSGPTIHVRAWIDGRSRIILDDATAQWQHFDWAAPGRLNCDGGAPLEPTFLGDVAWLPEWPDVPNCENRDCGGCLSDVYPDLPQAVPNVAVVPTLSVIAARGWVNLIEAPNAANGYRAVIEFDDSGIGAADWYEVDIQFGACGVVNYCTSTTNSSGAAATISVDGSLSVTGTDTRLHAAGCPPHRVGLFIYGGDAVQMPFCNGYLCVSPYSPGLFRIPQPVMIDSVGSAQASLDFAALPAAGTIGAGSTWNFQFWFRDGAAGGARANLTDAARVTFCP